MKIRFSQEVTVVKSDSADDDENPFITDSDVLKTLDGVKYLDEKFTDYLLDGEGTRDLVRTASIVGGVLSLRYAHDRNALLVETEYETNVALSDEDIQHLKDYTGIQLTDGLGSNFLQFFEPESNVALGFDGSYGEFDVEIIS